MGMQSDYTQNFLVDALFRGGALNSGGTVNSTATVKGIWTATTAYVVGDTVIPHANMTGAGGKFLRCTTAGTSGSTNTLAVPAVGSTLGDNTVTWTAVSGVPCPSTLYVALLKCTKGVRANTTAYALNDTIAVLVNASGGTNAGDGKYHYYKCTTAGTTAGAQGTLYAGLPNEVVTDNTAVFTEQTSAMDSNSAILVEPSAGGYARQALAASLTNWAGTQAAASTTSSTGTLGATSNNSQINFPTVSADYQGATEKIWGWALFDQLSGGNLLDWGPLNTPQSVLNGQSPPNFAISALVPTIGN
jgi:hypothetical protein